MTETAPAKLVAQGDLGRHPWPRILYSVYRKRLTGSMNLPGDGEATQIFFRDGTPVAALLPATPSTWAASCSRPTSSGRTSTTSVCAASPRPASARATSCARWAPSPPSS
jgi:hypothetical protein